MSGGTAGTKNGGDNGGGNGGGNPAASQSRVAVVGQYVKDFSFENPGAPGGFSERPQIDLSVDLQARQMDPQHYEVEMKLRVNAKSNEKPLFLLELSYAGLFQLVNVPEEVRQAVLLIDGPHLLFPFARRIVADAVRDGGMPPLMIEPIDFAALYRAKTEQLRAGGTGPVNA